MKKTIKSIWINPVHNYHPTMGFIWNIQFTDHSYYQATSDELMEKFPHLRNDPKFDDKYQALVGKKFLID